MTDHKDDNKELLEILKKQDAAKDDLVDESDDDDDDDNEEDEDEEDSKPNPKKKHIAGKLVQWSNNGDIYIPTGTTIKTIPPGAYEIQKSSSAGLYFERIPVKTENLLRFPDSNSDKVIDEIKTFWSRKDVFKKHGFPFKRGIILWGPPGSGKSATIQLIMKNVIEDLKGIVIIFDSPGLFMQGMRALRQIQKDIPVVAIMEDLDSILEYWSESSVLNILDGLNQIENCVFLATTNYPEKLGARVINRPSRFDKRFKIGFPSPEARMVYFKHLFGNLPNHGENLTRWVKDSEGFSMAHMKELFVAVKILGDSYEEAVEILQSMQEEISSTRDGDGNLGFGE